MSKLNDCDALFLSVVYVRIDVIELFCKLSYLTLKAFVFCLVFLGIDKAR